MPLPIDSTSTLVRPRFDTSSRLEDTTDADVWQYLYLLLTGAMGTLFVWALSSTQDSNLPFKLIFLALLVLTLKRWTGAVLLGLIQLHLLLIEPPSAEPITGPGGLLWVMLSIVLLLVLSRYRTLQDRRHAAGLTGLRRLVTGGLNRRPEQANHEWLNMQAMLWQLLRGVVMIAVCAGIAMVLLTMYPLMPEPDNPLYTIREFRLKSSGYRLIRLSLTLFAVVLVTWIVINEAVWRTLSRQQAGVYLRSTFLSWIHRDLRMVILKRMKIRRAKARKVPSVTRRDHIDETVKVSEPEY